MVVRRVAPSGSFAGLVAALLLLLSIPSPIQAAQATLAWDPGDPAPEGYLLFQRLQGGGYNYDAPAWRGAGNTCTIAGLADATTYLFVVRAFAGGAQSGDSNEVSFRYDPPAPSTYTISAAAGANGTITPAGSTVVAGGGSVTYLVSPSSGYRIAEVRVDGASVGAVASYTFNAVSADHTISAAFTANTYSVAATAGANGTITPAGSTVVAAGGSISYLVSPNAGYRIADTRVDGSSIGSASSYTFSPVYADHTISAAFTANTYLVNASAGANGTISPAGSVSVPSGGTQIFSIAPAAGYRVAEVRVDGASAGALSSYAFTNVTANHSISAAFAANTYTLTASAGEGGAILPAGSVSVTGGGSQTFTISPAAGYHVADVLVDGASAGAPASYTFGAVSANHSIRAIFAADNQPPAADAGPDQTVDEAQAVTLNGRNSRDADDGIARMQWRQLQGPAVMLNAADSAEAWFIAPDVGVEGAALVFELAVSDRSGARSTDTCIVNVSWVNQPPQANAGTDQTVASGQKVVLSAAGSADPDDGIAGYRWVQLQGPAVTLSDNTAAQPFFTAPAVGTAGVSLLFELTVTDRSGLKSNDTCTIAVTWSNAPPVADAGPDQQVLPGDKVILDGLASLDPDDGIAAYRWKQTAGTPVILSDTAAAQPFFTAPPAAELEVGLVFQLTVTDKGGLQSTDQCRIAVTPLESQPADSVPPTLLVSKPGSSYYSTKQNKIALAGSAGDNLRLARVTWKNDRGGGGQAVGTSSWQIPEVRLCRGYNVITVTAFDAAGNGASAAVTIHCGVLK